MKPRVCAAPELGVALFVFIVALALIVLPSHARAQGTCSATADSDGDGLTDAQECLGLTLPQGITLLDGTNFVPSCLISPSPRSNCLDPNTKDVFVIVVPAAIYENVPFLEYTSRLGPLYDHYQSRYFPDALVPAWSALLTRSAVRPVPTAPKTSRLPAGP